MSRWNAISPEKLRDEAVRDFKMQLEVEKLAGRLSPQRTEALTAAHLARVDSINAGLHPLIDASGEHRFTIQQGLKAACLAREDAAAGFLMQPTTLAYLRSIRWLMWVIVSLLIYIAFRVT